MRAELIYRDGDRAAVRMLPGWLRRLFGRKPSILELEWRDRVGGGAQWHAVGSRRYILDMAHHEKIRDALDFVTPAVPACQLVAPRAANRSELRFTAWWRARMGLK